MKSDKSINRNKDRLLIHYGICYANQLYIENILLDGLQF